ncbi:MAG TPA: SGNH/GDSL hydrolase family protein, partial [Candidatus Dormibacteraeota bacterium]|nr:SGNH/GDSL hydrolase family protein [Candidatus Dormibacteraeota bacterium]
MLHHRLRKNLSRSVQGVPFTTNSLGLRDREYPPPRPDGVFRILMLGDSFTEGAGLPIDETVAKRSERLLTTTCAGAYEVVNAGTGSYSPILEYLQLKHVGLALAPDLVVLNFDMTDVHDDYIRTLLATFDSAGLPLAVDPDRRREAA